MHSLAKFIGIVIPTYNRCSALLECLNHLENQTFKDFEVVVVDDGSTDSTEPEMRAYLARSPLAIRYVRQSNGGPAKARNLAISMLQSPVCLMIGDDIFASPTLVETHAGFHRDHPEIQSAALGWTQWSLSGQVITPFMQYLGESAVQFAYKDLLAGAQPDWHNFYTSNLSLKTDLLKQHAFNETFPYAAMEDCELGYRIQKKAGLNLRFLPNALAYHLHPTTFRQACRRMIFVGYSYRLFHEIWPEQRIPQPTVFRRGLKQMVKIIAATPLLLKLLIASADLLTRLKCPNILAEAAFACNYEVGYQSVRDSSGQLVQR